jgi:hypothetical protein
MAVIRRVLVLCVLLPLAACGAYAETGKAIDAEVDAVAKAVTHKTGTADELATAVAETRRGYGMSVEVLSADDLDPVREPTARLTVAFHFDGFSDGFGDAPERTSCYVLEFGKDGLLGEPDSVICSRDPWA